MNSFLLNSMFNPLDQFIVRPLFGNFNLGVTTFTLDTLLVTAVTFWIFYLLIFANKNLSHLYTFAISPALNMLSFGGVVGSKRYRPIYVFIFLVVAMSNLMGMIPFSLTSTSFAVVTFFLGSSVFIGINIIALASYNWKYVNLFLPSGAPLVMAPYLIVLEVISYFARVMSLSIRLFANLLSGHALMKIIGGAIFSTPLVAAGLITNLRPIATTRGGLADSFWALVSQVKGYWIQAVADFNSLLKEGDSWLHAYQVGYTVGFYEAVNTISAYIATVLVVFSAVGVMLYITAYYLHDELAKNCVEYWPEAAKNAVWFKVIWMFYGFRVWVISIMSQVKPAEFSAVRQPGVLGMALFVWAAFKHASRYVLHTIYLLVARGTVVNASVSFNQISSWNSYVAPVLSTAFWWLVVALYLTAHYLKLVQYLGFAHLTGVSNSWLDVITSKLWTFGPFGAGLVLSIVLVFAMLFDFICVCWVKVGADKSKVGQFFSSADCVWFDTLAAIAVGLVAGYIQVSAYYTLFDMAFVSAGAPDSFVFATLMRIAHWAPIYAIVAVLLAVIFTLIAEFVSNSMNADETRPVMKLLWTYGPALAAGLVLFELLYWGLVYDVLCAGTFEAYAMKVGIVGPPSPYWSDVFGSWEGYQTYVKAHAISYLTYTDLLWEKLLVNGYNPLFAITGSVLSGLYVFVAFISSTITAIGYYFYSEVVAISCAGLNSIVALVALITLPLITPIAWSFLLAITGLELAIALLQAYVFITLSSMYLNDVIKLH